MVVGGESAASFDPQTPALERAGAAPSCDRLRIARCLVLQVVVGGTVDVAPVSVAVAMQHPVVAP